MKNLSTSGAPTKSEGRPLILRHVDSRIVGLTLLNGFLFWPCIGSALLMMLDITIRSLF
jgi:hypothetical protein